MPPRTNARVIRYDWKTDQVVNLIEAVKKRPAIWDATFPSYKLNKQQNWREVVKELAPDISAQEAKCKWSALRVTFNTSLHKLNQRLREHNEDDEDEVPTVPWRYFEQMRFLESQKGEKKQKRPAPLNAASSETQMSAKKLKRIESPSMPSSPECERKFIPFMPTPPTHSDSLPMIEHEQVFQMEAPPVLQPPDRNATFCEYILAELRSLPETDAFGLRRALNRAMWDFLESKNS